MLSKTLFIALDKLKPKNITVGLRFFYAFDYSICYYIRKTLESLSYSHLTISYEYNIDRIYHVSNSVYEESLEGLDKTELLSFNYLLERFIIQTIEEFNIVCKTNSTFVLNFNSTIINGNNFVISSETIDITTKDFTYA